MSNIKKSITIVIEAIDEVNYEDALRVAIKSIDAGNIQGFDSNATDSSYSFDIKDIV